MTPSFGLGPAMAGRRLGCPGPGVGIGEGYVGSKIAGKRGSGEGSEEMCGDTAPPPSLPASPLCSAAEPEQHDVPILYHVLLTLAPGDTLLARRLPSTHSDEVAVRHRLGSNEPLLEVGVDHP